MVLVGGELAWSMLNQTSGMISSPCWKVGTEHRHYFVLKLAWHPRLNKPSHVCEHFLNSVIYKHSFRSGSQKRQARTQLQTKSLNLSLMLLGTLEPEFFLGEGPNLRQVCWAFMTSVRPSLVRARTCQPLWMLMGTMAPAAQGQSSKEGYRGHPLRPSTLKAADGYTERVRGIWGDLLGYHQHLIHILLHYTS